MGKYKMFQTTNQWSCWRIMDKRITIDYGISLVVDVFFFFFDVENLGGARRLELEVSLEF